MERICEVCGRTEDITDENVEHDLLDVCHNCTTELKAHANRLNEN